MRARNLILLFTYHFPACGSPLFSGNGIRKSGLRGCSLTWRAAYLWAGVKRYLLGIPGAAAHQQDTCKVALHKLSSSIPQALYPGLWGEGGKEAIGWPGEKEKAVEETNSQGPPYCQTALLPPLSCSLEAHCQPSNSWQMAQAGHPGGLKMGHPSPLRESESWRKRVWAQGTSALLLLLLCRGNIASQIRAKCMMQLQKNPVLGSINRVPTKGRPSSSPVYNRDVAGSIRGPVLRSAI